MSTTTNGTMGPATAAMTVRGDERSAMLAFEPQDMRGLVDLSKILYESKLLPKAIQSWQAAVTIAIRGRELGLTIMQAFSSIYIIEGKVVLSGDLIVGMVKRNAECRYMRLVECTNERCVYETQRVGDPEPTRIAWSMDDAKAAGLNTKDNWRKYPRAMLRARCGAEISRAVYPDLAMGMYDPDEISSPSPGGNAPQAHDEMTGEVVSPEDAKQDATRAEAIRGQLQKIARDGTKADLSAIGAAIASAGFPQSIRDSLSGDYRAAQAAIKAREAKPVAVVDDPYADRSDADEGPSQ
jgi:hypothetical protein